MKLKRTYKIIACFSIWLSVIICFFGLAIAKPKAGVIISTTYNFTRTPDNSSSTNSIDLQYLEYIAFYNNITTSNITIGTIRNISPTTSMYNISLNLNVYDGEEYPLSSTNQRCRINITANSGYPSITWHYVRYINYYEETSGNTYIVVDLSTLNNDMQEAGYDPSELELNLTSGRIYFAFANNTITPVQNIYDLNQNDVALIYISDISGIDSGAYRDEITINWGYIDNNDNTLFTVHDPTIQAQRTDNNIISLAMPINAAGDVTSYYEIDQSAILSTISAGGATATAHIYGIYVWVQQSRIQWGLAEFDTSGLPASGASMNYITSLTSLYDYTATNTSTMTCRLSISNNFNFITIKNQPILSAQNINTVIQQGGFLPAWAVYNWARGSSAGYTSGEQAGAAPYQPGGAGYQQIFEAGRQAGIAENIGTVNWFISAFEAVDAMLNIRIFPNITIGYLVGIPFVISITWLIIRMFRGGGSSS